MKKLYQMMKLLEKSSLGSYKELWGRIGRVRLSTSLSQFFSPFSRIFSASLYPFSTHASLSSSLHSNSTPSHSNLTPLLTQSQNPHFRLLFYISQPSSLLSNFILFLNLSTNFLYPVLLFLLTYPQFSLILKYFIILTLCTLNSILIFY